MRTRPNTLKNHGYHFERNFGHGHQNLSDNLSMLRILVFAIDQIQQLTCKTFQAAKKNYNSLCALWEERKSRFKDFLFKNWYALFATLIYKTECTVVTTEVRNMS